MNVTNKTLATKKQVRCFLTSNTELAVKVAAVKRGQLLQDFYEVVVVAGLRAMAKGKS